MQLNNPQPDSDEYHVGKEILRQCAEHNIQLSEQETAILSIERDPFASLFGSVIFRIYLRCIEIDQKNAEQILERLAEEFEPTTDLQIRLITTKIKTLKEIQRLCQRN